MAIFEKRPFWIFFSKKKKKIVHESRFLEAPFVLMLRIKSASLKILRIGDFENLSFFESTNLISFFTKKNPMKISPNLHGRMDGSKF